MDITKYLSVLIILCLEEGETGGHGEKHHDHVRLHIPEFIHHDYHKKVITIHHHHHKPKKEHHHHHHHHHHKPHVPQGHHYHHHHKKSHSTSHSVSKGHRGHHGHHGHHKHHSSHGHHGHHGHHSHKHNHHGNGHGSHHHHDTPSISYDPISIPSFEDDTGYSYPSSVPDYGTSVAGQIPKVHGVTHTVKQVKVYDSVPGVIPGNIANHHGYEVTENHGDDGDEDIFTSVNDIQQSYPATYGYLRGAGAQSASPDPFGNLGPHTAIPLNNNEAFGAAPQSLSGLENVDTFAGTMPSGTFSSSVPAPHVSISDNLSSSEYPGSFQTELSLDSPPISFTGTEDDRTAFTASDEGSMLSDTPVSFAREAGIQHITNTGGVETVAY